MYMYKLSTTLCAHLFFYELWFILTKCVLCGLYSNDDISLAFSYLPFSFRMPRKKRFQHRKKKEKEIRMKRQSGTSYIL